LFDGEEALEFGPFGGELFVLEEGLFLLVEFLGLLEHFFVAAGFDEALELGDDGLGFGRWRGSIRCKSCTTFDSFLNFEF